MTVLNRIGVLLATRGVMTQSLDPDPELDLQLFGYFRSRFGLEVAVAMRLIKFGLWLNIIP